jgi:hypothetical protein
MRRKKNIVTGKEEFICFEKQKLDVELKKEEIEKQKLEIELRQEAREQEKDEREIMIMDTRCLSSIQLEYIQSLQMEIMQKRRAN